MPGRIIVEMSTQASQIRVMIAASFSVPTYTVVPAWMHRSLLNSLITSHWSSAVNESPSSVLVNVAKANAKINVTPISPSIRKAPMRRPTTAVGFDNEGLDGGEGMVCTLPSVAHGGGPPVASASMSETASPDPELFDKIVNLSKRRGFVFQSAEIYGGFRSTYDYGPLGVLLLRNVKDAWWRSMVQERHDVVGLDASILSPPQVWQASGHLANFSDPLVDCTNCNARHRLDKLDDPNVCPTCGSEGTFTEAREFNLMFKTHAGPVTETAAEVYLRPETAQGMFINFANVLNTSRKRPPFGIAQIGKSFRNEITPGTCVPYS